MCASVLRFTPEQLCPKDSFETIFNEALNNWVPGWSSKEIAGPYSAIFELYALARAAVHEAAEVYLHSLRQKDVIFAIDETMLYRNKCLKYLKLAIGDCAGMLLEKKSSMINKYNQGSEVFRFPGLFALKTVERNKETLKVLAQQQASGSYDEMLKMCLNLISLTAADSIINRCNKMINATDPVAGKYFTLNIAKSSIQKFMNWNMDLPPEAFEYGLNYYSAMLMKSYLELHENTPGVEELKLWLSINPNQTLDSVKQAVNLQMQDLIANARADHLKRYTIRMKQSQQKELKNRKKSKHRIEQNQQITVVLLRK
jgi:hypothetical protein